LSTPGLSAGRSRPSPACESGVSPLTMTLPHPDFVGTLNETGGPVKRRCRYAKADEQTENMRPVTWVEAGGHVPFGRGPHPTARPVVIGTRPLTRPRIFRRGGPMCPPVITLAFRVSRGTNLRFIIFIGQRSPIRVPAPVDGILYLGAPPYTLLRQGVIIVMFSEGEMLAHSGY